jgi:arylsulfatase A-like enzyme
LIMSGPGVPANRRVDAFCYLLDVFPTLAELAGVPALPDLDGRSLAPVFRNSSTTVRPVIFTAYRNFQRAVRDDRWKLIRYPRVDQNQLFDLRTDPYETKNLANDPEFVDRVKQMMTSLALQQKEWGDVAPLHVQSPEPARWVPPAAGAK